MIFLIRLKFMFEDLFSLIRCHVIWNRLPHDQLTMKLPHHRSFIESVTNLNVLKQYTWTLLYVKEWQLQIEWHGTHQEVSPPPILIWIRNLEKNWIYQNSSKNKNRNIKLSLLCFITKQTGWSLYKYIQTTKPKLALYLGNNSNSAAYC